MIKKTCFVFVVGLGVFLASCGGVSNIGAGGSTASAPSAIQSFTAGIAHVAGNYGFTQENYLVEGAEQISKLGSNSIFVYLTPHFRDQYPDRKAGM